MVQTKKEGNMVEFKDPEEYPISIHYKSGYEYYRVNSDEVEHMYRDGDKWKIEDVKPPPNWKGWCRYPFPTVFFKKQ
jgi:hypothetical protein